MLTKIQVFNEDEQGLELPLDGTESQYILKEIEGLGPVNASIVTTEYATMDGGVFQNAKRGQRNIVLKIGFDPNYETDDPFGTLRRELYTWFIPEAKVDIHFLSNNLETVSIIGYVETFEPVIFSQEPEVSISIICPYPHFSSLVPITLPFSIPGDTSTVASLIVVNPGNVPAGFTLTVDHYFPDTMTGFTLTRASRDSVGMTYTEQLGTLEETVAIRINTVKGSKSARWKLQSAYTDPNAPFGGANILGYIDQWVELMPGSNALTLQYYAAFTPVTARAHLTFTARYVGL